MIRVEDLSFSYIKDSPVLSEISFTVPKGKITGVIGPNGSGKTTLLRLLSGYLHPDTGGVYLEGHDVSAYSAREIARKMALLQQKFSMEYDFSVMDIVLAGRNPYVKKMRGETEEDYRIARESMRLAGIDDLAERSVFALSGGEQQMVMLARALCQEAPVLLLDEPVTGLDIRHQIEFLSTVHKMSRQKNITVVCILHDLNLCMSYCDHVVLLQQGKVCVSGDPQTVLTKETIERVYQTEVSLIIREGHTYILPRIET